MENEPAVPLSGVNSPRTSCYCWKCYVQADFLLDFGSIQEYRCPKCYVQIRVGDPDIFDTLRTPFDDSDSVSVCVSTTTSRRSTITYSESEPGASDDVDTRPLTPENVDLSTLVQSAQTNTQADGDTPDAPPNTPADSDVPDAPPNIAKAFAEVTNFLLNVSTPTRRPQRFSFGAISSISGSNTVSPSKMIENVVQAYKKCSQSLAGDFDKSEEMGNDHLEHSIEIRITPSSDTNEITEIFTR